MPSYFRALIAAAVLIAPLAGGAPSAASTPQEKVIDAVSFEGLKLGMTEKEVVDKFPDADFSASGGLRRGSFIATISKQPTILSSDVDKALEKITTKDGIVVDLSLRFYPGSFAALEQHLTDQWGAPKSDVTHTMGRRSKTGYTETIETRRETWFGSTSYIEYHRSTSNDPGLCSLFISRYPKQFNRDHYGPLKANITKDADFYITQDGHLVKSERQGDALVFYMKNGPFQIGGNAEHIQIALAQHDMGEIVAELDPTSSFQVSCFRPTLSVSADRDSEKNDDIWISDGRMGCEGLSWFDPKHSKLGKPIPGYKFAFEVDQLYFYSAPGLSLENFKGVLQGFIQVQKPGAPDFDLRKVDGFPPEDISPIRLVFQ